jgi:hypothetical protein
LELGVWSLKPENKKTKPIRLAIPSIRQHKEYNI